MRVVSEVLIARLDSTKRIVYCTATKTSRRWHHARYAQAASSQFMDGQLRLWVLSGMTHISYVLTARSRSFEVMWNTVEVRTALRTLVHCFCHNAWDARNQWNVKPW